MLDLHEDADPTDEGPEWLMGSPVRNRRTGRHLHLVPSRKGKWAYREGTNLRLIQWAKENKRLLSAVVLFISGGFEALGLREVSVPLAALAFWLHGAGAAPSDKAEKAKP